MILHIRQIESGLKDIKGLLIALTIIFFVAPVFATVFGMIPLETGIKIGIFIIAVMPTTLSSGVVMTGAAGGNMAHALLITIVASSLSVVTIPYTLSALLNFLGGSAVIAINKTEIMQKIGFLVLVPLFSGVMIKSYSKSLLFRAEPKMQILNQCLVLGIVWMALSQTRHVIVSSKEAIGIICLSVFVFHGVLLVAAIFFTRLFKLGRGRRESVIFMGAQKTLPLSILLQVSLFPQLGQVLFVCVMHNLVQLLMDSDLIGKLRRY